jgi:hypothetical protein
VSTIIERQSRHVQQTRREEPVIRVVPTLSDRLGNYATALLIGATILGATLLFWLVHRSLIDDAYITLAYARTLAEHGDWGMLPGHESNSATSPLNVLLLGGISALVGDPVVAAGVLYVLTCVALVIGLRGIGHAAGLGYRVAVLGGPLLIGSPLLASTIGLETMLVVTGMTYLAWACLRGDPVMAGLTAGAMAWLRLDTVVIAAVLILATPALLRRLHVTIGLAAAVVMPWLVYSWVALDSAIPDTLVIKQGDTWGDFTTGLYKRYSEPYTWVVFGVLVLGGFGVLSVLTWVWWRRRTIGPPVVPALALAGAAYFGLMWALDVPPFFWYYAPTLAALALAGAIGLAALSGPASGRVTRSVAVTVGVGLVGVTMVPWWLGASAHAPLREMPIHGNWALPGEYQEIGEELGAIVGDTPVHSPGEVGSLAYFCDCTIVDRFSDRGVLADPIEDAREDSWLYELNYQGLDTDDLDPIKPGYWLVWRPGPDPTDLGWDSTGIAGSYREHGHFELLTEPPRRLASEPSDSPTAGPKPRGDGSLR